MATTLAQIQLKARNIAQVQSEQALSTTALNEYINNYYQYEFPEELRLLPLLQNYTFYTTPNVDTYPFPQTFVTCEPPMWASGQPIQWVQDQNTFYTYWQKNLNLLMNVAQGNNTTGPYAYQVSGVPILAGEVIISDTLDQEIFTDVGTGQNIGVLVGNQGGTGSVNYLTGQLSWTYASPLPNGTNIAVQVFQYNPSRPVSVLFFDQEFVLRPVPDQVYEMRVQAYAQPTELLNASDEPVLNEWWQFLAIGAATKIIEDRMDMNLLQQALALLEKQRKLIRRRTLIELVNRSVPTIFNTPSGPFYTLNSYPYGA